MASADRIIELLHEAKARPAGTERERFVAEACRDDAGLKEQIISLLEVDAAEGESDFLKGTPLIRQTAFVTGKPGDKIGRYKLLEQIGEGGCGVVYMAEQEEPVRRRVALKVIKLGMDTKSVIARFEAERQALAMMDHPNIARDFDAGATDTGRPYFVMELVRGIKITDFCDQNNLSTNDRLELFMQVCQAIQHAHQKGIIHRDIKPSNILVTISEPGAPGCPKVIDFGIAKATTGQRLTDKTVFTAFEQFIGTPAYMSPEQAMMTSLDIDTRTDIYALGVLLYELLTGQTPFDGEQLMSAGLDEMRRIIRDEQPPKPSTRLTSLVAADARRITAKSEVRNPKSEPDGASSHRLLPTKGPSNTVRGDLDWIVMKCLEKDRSRRYETASGIAADIQRHLNDEPITARPPSRMYFLQKLGQRNRGALIAAVTVLAALLVALLSLATSNARIQHALRDRSSALEAARNSEHRAREQLFVSLQSQAQARRNSRQMGQRTESLAALAEAARIRPTPELRDNATAAMAVPDVEQGPAWQIQEAISKVITYDSRYERYARLEKDGAISIRTIPEDRELRRLESNPSARTGSAGVQLTFSPDGRFIALLAESGKLQVWEWASGKLVLKSPPEKCSALAFSPDNRRLAGGHEDWITCFDLSTGEPSCKWQARDRPYKLDFHPDSRRIAVGYFRSNLVSIYNAQDGGELAVFPTGNSSLTTVAWHPEGNLLAMGGSDPRIQIWAVAARRKFAELEGHAQQVSTLTFHPGGDLLISTSWDGVVRLWQLSPGRLLMRLPPSGWVGFSKEDGRWAGVIRSSEHHAQLWGLVRSQEYYTFHHTFSEGGGLLREGDISADGAMLALGATDGIRLWNVAQGREVARVPTGDTMCAMFGDGGRELLTCGRIDGLRRWSILTNREPEGGLQLSLAHQFELPFAPERLAKGLDGRTLAVVGEQPGQCVFLDLVARSVRVAEMPHSLAGFVALSPDGKRLASSGWHSKRVKLWDGTNGKLVKELEVFEASRVFFPPNNQELMVARSYEFTFHTLDSLAVSRRLPREVGLNPGFVAFTADGKLMAVEMAPGVIHLKEISSGRTVAKLEDPHGDVSTWMSFTPDGTQLIVAAQYAGAIHRWDLRAIRARLKTMNLDWDWPEFSDSGRDLVLEKPSAPARSGD